MSEKKTVLFLSSSLLGHNTNNMYIKQNLEGLKSIIKCIDYFNEKNIDIIYVDNTIENLDKFPEIKENIPPSIKTIFDIHNTYGRQSKTAGVIEHWIMSRDIWEKYEYMIFFEIRQKLLDLRFFEEFLKEPISIFSWNHSKLINSNISFPTGLFKNKDSNFNIKEYGYDNRNHTSLLFNDFYTGLMSIKVNELKNLVDTIDLIKIIKFQPGLGMIALEKLLMCFAYNTLEKFRMIDSVGVVRYSNYTSLNNPTYY